MQRIENPLPALIGAGIFLYGYYETQNYRFDPEYQYVPHILGGIAILLFLRVFFIVVFFILPQAIRYLFILKKIKGRAGTSDWASKRELIKSGLFKRRLGKEEKFYCGGFEHKAVYVPIESSGLVLSPAGGGKTTGFVMPALLNNQCSMLIPDLKGTLSCMSAKHREKKFKHTCIFVNPTGLYAERLGSSACYNPLQILMDDWENPNLRPNLLPDARSIARQLYPEPAHAGENKYFRSGSRKVMVFAFIYHTISESYTALSDALALISDPQAFEGALNTAAGSDALNGDFSLLAKDILKKLDDGDSRQIESFREGALQALEIFSSSSPLAKSTSKCDFQFSDMRKNKTTIYVIADPTRIADYAPWVGLLSWCALTELIRVPRGNRVCFLCDEVTNFKIDGLPALLTLAREFNIILWLIVQELEQWAHVYGRESLETLLSQTEAKIFLGVRAHKTCQLVSDMLGDKSLKTINHNLGGSFFDRITRNVQEQGRRLLTPDEVRRFEEIILIYRRLKPIALDPIGYHQIHPWRKQAGINPLFGKRYKERKVLSIN